MSQAAGLCLHYNALLQKYPHQEIVFAKTPQPPPKQMVNTGVPSALFNIHFVGDAADAIVDLLTVYRVGITIEMTTRYDSYLCCIKGKFIGCNALGVFGTVEIMSACCTELPSDPMYCKKFKLVCPFDTKIGHSTASLQKKVVELRYLGFLRRFTDTNEQKLENVEDFSRAPMLANPPKIIKLAPLVVQQLKAHVNSHTKGYTPRHMQSDVHVHQVESRMY